MCIRPRIEKNALQTPRTGRFPDFEYCQVVDRQSLKLLSTHVLVYYGVLANYNVKLSKILCHGFLSMDSFRFCETYLLHIKLFVGNQSMVSPFLGGYIYTYTYTYAYKCVYMYICIHMYIETEASDQRPNFDH